MSTQHTHSDHTLKTNCVLPAQNVWMHAHTYPQPPIQHHCLVTEIYGGTSMAVFFFWGDSPQWARASSFRRFLDHTHTQRCITLGRTPLDEWSARSRDLYLTTHNTHSRHTSITPLGFKPIISEGERPQTYTLDRAATETGSTAVVNRNTVQERITRQRLPWAQR
jgi:hypothetical protein